MHGIERTRNLQHSSGPDIAIRTVQLRYADGRVLTFMPDAGREVFSEDDILELQRVLGRASSAAEWDEVMAHTNE